MTPKKFDKYLILVKDFVGRQQVKYINIEKAIFLVRVYDLPLLACNEHVKRKVRAALGRVEEVDIALGEVKWGEHMRFRVELDVTKPLVH